MTIDVGCGQITWNQFHSAEEDVLRDIHEAGYDGAPWRAGRDTSGNPSQVAEQVRRVYQRHELVPAPGYFSAIFWEREQQPAIVEAAKRHAAITAQLGLTETFVAEGSFGRTMPSGRTRSQAAAHVTPADRLPDDQFKMLADGVSAAASAMLAEGVRACFHNHVGTVVETGQEIETLLELTDPEVLFLGPDTGHLAWGGVDVVDFCRRHAARIRCLHLKDIVAEVREEGIRADWDYGTFSDRGVFTELGDGFEDFAGMLAALRDQGFDGWLIIETDVTQRPSALESATISRQNLRALGV